MKKVLILVAAFLVIFSSVAAVSATEGHLVDIKAHVENAIGVETYELDFGSVFPEETIEKQLTFGLSNSFVSENQTRLSSLVYNLYWELKPIEGDAIDPDCDTYFEPLNPFLIVSDLDPSDGNDSFESQPTAVPTPTAAVLLGTGRLTKSIPQPAAGPEGDLCDMINIAFYAPVFDRWYNELTDPLYPWPYILNYTDDGQCNDDYEIVTETVCGYDVPVPHADLGINLKIQVMDYIEH